MEANDKLILWALAQRTAGLLDLEIKKLSWGDYYSGEIVDIEVNLNWKGEVLKGRGTTKDSKKSLAIAITEALERIPASSMTTGSNGLAAHVSFEAARSGALKEIVERDAFLMSYLAGLPLVRLDLKEIKIAESLRGDFLHLNSRGVNVDVFGVARSFDHFVVMAILDGRQSEKPFGLNLGLGCEENIESAAEKALLEILRNGYWAIHKDTDISPKNLKDFSALKEVKSSDHLALGLDINYAAGILDDFSSRKEASDFFVLPSIGEFEFEQISWPTEIEPLPLFIVQCKNEGLQNLYWGSDNQKFLNLKRWDSIKYPNKDLRRLKIPPHPIG